MHNNRTITFTRIKELVIQHPFWLILCFVVGIWLETFFISYPPRGVAAENHIVLGSQNGRAIVSFEGLWLKCIHDDNYMLEIIDSLKLKQLDKPIDRLNFLNRSVRPKLSFSKLGSRIIKIRFEQPGYSIVRIFLNTFTDNIMRKLNKIANEEIKALTINKQLILNQLLQKSFLIGELFDVEGRVSGFSDKEVTHNNYTTTNGGRFFSNIGMQLINGLRNSIFQAYNDLQSCINVNSEFKTIFPHKTQLLTLKNTPAHPVQPFLNLLYIMIPIATLLIAFSGLILFDNQQLCQINQ